MLFVVAAAGFWMLAWLSVPGLWALRHGRLAGVAALVLLAGPLTAIVVVTAAHDPGADVDEPWPLWAILTLGTALGMIPSAIVAAVLFVVTSVTASFRWSGQR